MEVILLERVEKLGQMGDVVTVKNGFARNFLLPQNKALRATEANRKRFENERAALETRNLEQRSEAETVSERMQGLSVILVRQASEMGQLYGSVSARDIAAAIAEKDIQVERRQVVLDRPIKSLGLHDVRIVLHPEVSVIVEANVARSEAEAEQQKALGGFSYEAFTAQGDDDDDADADNDGDASDEDSSPDEGGEVADSESAPDTTQT